MAIKINKHIIFCEEKNESMLINFVDNYMIGLDYISTVIWKELMKNQGELEIIDYLAEKYQEDKKMLSKDIKEFLNSLEQVGVIKN
ncbi:PqqD family protein [Virgibacillus chiguensis]|uniref:Coenzyme PQQ synthesis protein D (PqqD) n=1 Tax=Virgibacillus chiguensis TaxID=411959 RepID=A0A1M5TAW6_9BACI|nr:PqqD family protein [Virgibacillus chiguensis]SHH47879.1 Coenzyme PQQ synthesis protein D (PqqD) [Virgibacillus chiguensis]